MAVHPARRVDGVDHLSCPEMLELCITIFIAQLEGDAATRATTVQRKHEAGLFRRAAIDGAFHAEAAMPAVNEGGARLDGFAFGPPDERGIGEEPQVAARAYAPDAFEFSFGSRCHAHVVYDDGKLSVSEGWDNSAIESKEYKMIGVDEEEQRYGLWAALAAVFLAIAFTLGIAISKTSMFSDKHKAVQGKAAPAVATAAVAAAKPSDATAHAPAASAEPAAATATAAGTAMNVNTSAVAPAKSGDDMLPVGEPVAKFYFASGKAELPADAKVGLEKVIALSKEKAGASVLLSGFHDATGDPAKNAELAKDRAKAVREALRNMGIDEVRMFMRKPEVLTGTGDAKEARRVEVRVQ